MFDCEFDGFGRKPAINFQVYTHKQLCEAVTVENCIFDNCRQPIKFEIWLDDDSTITYQDQTTYNVHVKGCLFDITNSVGVEGCYNVNPTAIWIEAQGDYNILVEDCEIRGKGLSDLTKNFRNGIVLDVSHEDTDLHIAMKNVTIGDNVGQKGVKENGIFIRTSALGELITQLDDSLHPNTGDTGFNNIDINNCMTGDGIWIESKSRATPVDISIFDSNIYNHEQGNGIDISVDDNSSLYILMDNNIIHDNDQGTGVDIDLTDNANLDIEITDNSIHDNGEGGINVETFSGTCNLEIIGNDIFDTSPSQNMGYSGVYLRTCTPVGSDYPSLLTAKMDKNRIHELQGYGLRVLADDQWLFSNLLKLTDSNDRIYNNLDHGVYLNGLPGYSTSCIRAKFLYLTSCDNAGMGIAFDDDGRHDVSIINSIFWGHSAINGDVDPNYEGGITFSDWAEGLYNGGYGHPNNPAAGCIEDDPLFVIGSIYHLQYNPGGIQSPCVDVGDDSAVRIVPLDMENDNREIDGDGDLDLRTDMGADEHDPGG